MLVGAINTARESFINQRIAMGDSEAAAASLADQYGLIPQTVATRVELNNLAAVEDALRQFVTTWNGKTVTVNASANLYSASGGMPNGGTATKRNAVGNVLEFYASGGVRTPQLTPMPALAQMVPANTWRVVGDRSDVPEAYIPIQPTARSLALLDETADRLGRITIPKASLAMNAAGSITPTAAAAGGASLAGLSIEGTLDLGGGLTGTIRGVVKSELADEASRLRYVNPRA